MGTESVNEDGGIKENRAPYQPERPQRRPRKRKVSVRA